MCIIMADLRCCMAETNTTLESNFPPIKKHINPVQSHIGGKTTGEQGNSEGRLQGQGLRCDQEEVQRACGCYFFTWVVVSQVFTLQPFIKLCAYIDTPTDVYFFTYAIFFFTKKKSKKEQTQELEKV